MTKVKIDPIHEHCRVKIESFLSDHETHLNGIGLAPVAKTIMKWYVAFCRVDTISPPMAASPRDITLSIQPESRFDVIDVAERVRGEEDDFFERFNRSAFTSYHTTAGYFEQSFANRLKNNPEALEAYLETFQKLFPPDADYQHDQMELRDELSEEQKAVEPRNADSHLTFIGSGLENTVTYLNRKPHESVWFVDLDGTNGEERRNRRTTVIGYNRETVTHRRQVPIRMSGHPIDSVNLWDARLGLLEELQHEANKLGIRKGRIDLALAPDESHTGLTVNEYETLLMQHDLVDVLRDPIRFMAQKGRNMIKDPGAIKEKAKDYMKYDLVHVVNEFIDAMGLSETLVERIIDKFFQVPAHRFLRMKRSVSMIVSDGSNGSESHIVSGTYQSPILVQWKRRDERRERILEATFTRFD